VYNGRIIGEGYHQKAGQAHAEVHCLQSVNPRDRRFIPAATLYVSLEPCCIIGKTGACSTLIINNKIRTVVIAQRDGTPGVAGDSIRILREAGVTVREYPNFTATWPAYQFRHTLVTEGIPYVTLKFAQSRDGFLRPAERNSEYWITNSISRRLVHQWRSKETGIIVGARTVLDDDPSLTTRLWPGPDPVPIVVDPRGRLSGKEKVFRGPVVPVLFTSAKLEAPRVDVVSIPNNLNTETLLYILQQLAARRMANVTVEGGGALLSAFLTSGLWKEARVFTGRPIYKDGLTSPDPLQYGGEVVQETRIGSDKLVCYLNGNTKPVGSSQL